MAKNIPCPCITAPGISLPQANLLLLPLEKALIEQATNKPNSEPA